MNGKIIKGAFMETIDNQLKANDPPFVKTTLDRLLKKGLSRDEAKSLMAGTVAYLMFDMIAFDEPFNEVEYERLLHDLPNLPPD